MADQLQTPNDLLTDPDFWTRSLADRMAAYARLRSEDPVSWQPEFENAWVPEGGPGYWAVTRYEDVVSVSKDFKNFSSAQGTNPMDEPDQPLEVMGMLHMDPPDHRRMRRIVNPAFMDKALDKLMPLIENTADEVLDRISVDGEIDIVDPLIGHYAITVICDVLGLPAEERPEFLAAITRGFSPDRTAAVEAHKYMTDFVIKLARERRENPGDDVLSLVANAEVDGERLTDIDVAYFVVLLLGAGSETSAATILQGMWHLSENRDQLDKWRADFDGLAPTAVEEMLRIGSAVICFRRTATEDITLHGADIKTGQKVVLFYESANNDETVFENPGQFDIARDPNRHVSFGGFGPHLCLGAPLARKEINIFFRKLFERFEDFTVVGPPELAPNQRFNMVKSMKVNLKPR